MPFPSVIRPLNSVLVKPSGPDCNLDCGYCFYLKKAALFPETPVHRMGEPVLEAMIRQVMRGGSRQVNFGWQGGEPTLMGLDFFRKAVEFQKRYGEPGQEVGNGLQTNGVLVDAEWAEFFHENNFLIGLSLDGPQHVHDRHRRDRGGRPTWESVTRAARLLRQRGVEVNALSVVTDYSARFPEEIYKFHKSLGLRYMQFIPCVEPDPADPSRTAAFSVAPEAYGDFLRRVFDLWTKDIKNGFATTSVRWFDSLFHLYVGLPAPECTLGKECGCYVVIEHNGDVYACDFFVEDLWRLGNVLRDDLLELLNSPRQGEFGRLKAELPERCKECEWLSFCRGGCPKDRQSNPQSRGVSHFCEAYRMFFAHAHERLLRLAAAWKKRNAPQAH